MRKKFGTLLNSQLIHQMKLEATREKLPLNDLIERAMWHYLEIGSAKATPHQSFTEKTKGILNVSKKNLHDSFSEELDDA